MTVKIPLVVRGLDLRDPSALDRIDEDLVELDWKSNGALTLAVVYSDATRGAAISEAADWARRIHKLMPGVRISGVHDELVSVSDIAARAGVAPEAARLWATGQRRASAANPFPAPRQVVGTGSGGKSMSLYAWREVVTWVRSALGIDPDEGIEYLDDASLADLGADLAGARPPVGGWQPMQVTPLTLLDRVPTGDEDSHDFGTALWSSSPSVSTQPTSITTRILAATG